MKNEVMTISTTIESIEPTLTYGEKYKLAFRGVSATGTPRLCIYWGYGIIPKISVGDKAILTGKIKNDVFLVYILKFRSQGA